MGSDGSPDRTVRRGYDRTASRLFSQHCCLSSVLPFIVGLLLVLSIFQFRSASFRYGSSDPRRLLTQSARVDSLRRACESCKCPPGGQSDLASKLAGTLTSQTAAAVLDAANSTEPALQTVRVNEDSLESLFLFIGVLSGRGYRHRRLAVREAWGNRAQVPGISAARFILSEDERTPQVNKFCLAHPASGMEQCLSMHLKSRKCSGPMQHQYTSSCHRSDHSCSGWGETYCRIFDTVFEEGKLP